MESMEIIEFNERITKIKKQGIPHENYENHENHEIPINNYQNHENHRIP